MWNGLFDKLLTKISSVLGPHVVNMCVTPPQHLLRSPYPALKCFSRFFLVCILGSVMAAMAQMPEQEF